MFNNLIDNALYSTGDGSPTTKHMAAITFYVALGKNMPLKAYKKKKKISYFVCLNHESKMVVRIEQEGRGGGGTRKRGGKDNSEREISIMDPNIYDMDLGK